MLVEELQPYFEAQPQGYDCPATFYLTINKTKVNNSWSAGYQDYATGKILIGTNHCDSLDEVYVRLTARLQRYMRLHAPKPRTLHDMPEYSTVGNTNLMEDITMSDSQENTEATLTHGQQLVGLNFNPDGDPRVTELKQLAARQIDILEEIQTEQFPNAENGGTRPDYDTNLLQGNAYREVISAQMATVKRATWKPRNMPVPDTNKQA